MYIAPLLHTQGLKDWKTSGMRVDASIRCSHLRTVHRRHTPCLMQ